MRVSHRILIGNLIKLYISIVPAQTNTTNLIEMLFIRKLSDEYFIHCIYSPLIPSALIEVQISQTFR